VRDDLLGELRAGSLAMWSITFVAGRTDSAATLEGLGLLRDPVAAVQLSLTVFPSARTWSNW
jgi:hypothetical protein